MSETKTVRVEVTAEDIRDAMEDDPQTAAAALAIDRMTTIGYAEAGRGSIRIIDNGTLIAKVKMPAIVQECNRARRYGQPFAPFAFEITLPVEVLR
jgi:hypothetical protein